MIQFVANYEDLSTDRGYQFKFHCDKCGNGFMSQFDPSIIGTAGGLLRAASNFLGGWAGSAGDSAYDIQRAVGGKAHDAALEKAVLEGKRHFHQCSRCGKWVCPEVCWNEAAGQCEECAPKFEEEIASAHAHAKADAARQQLVEKAAQTDYVGNIDMKSGSVMSSTGGRAPLKPAFCSECGAQVGQAKFCPECGVAVKPKKAACPGCGFEPPNPVKFCPECGGKMA
jgi:hypothetical protein